MLILTSLPFHVLTVTCQVPSVVPNSIRSRPQVTSFDQGDTVTYTCNPCFTGGGTITCLASGQWTQTTFCTGEIYFCQRGIYIHCMFWHWHSLKSNTSVSLRKKTKRVITRIQIIYSCVCVCVWSNVIDFSLFSHIWIWLNCSRDL